MLIGGDDISNDVITFGTCFPMFFYIRARFLFGLIVGNLTAQSTRSTGKLEVEFKFQRLSWKLSFRPAARVPGRTCSQATPTFVRESAMLSVSGLGFVPAQKLSGIPLV